MPRLVDRDDREAAIVEAVWRLVLRGGLAEASVRKVAAEAGLSTGSVRHFFADQQELLHFAMREIVRRIGDRVAATYAERMRELGAGRPVLAVLSLLAQLLPIDAERQTEATVWFAFAAQDAADETVRAIRQEQDRKLRELCAQCVHGLAEAGALGAGRDQHTEATLLCAVLDGLTVGLLLRRPDFDADAALAVLRTHLEQLAMRPAVGSGPQ